MSDDKSKRGPQDRRQINLSEDYEVRYWCGKFGVDSQTLKAAVKALKSNDVARVAKYLK